MHRSAAFTEFKGPIAPGATTTPRARHPLSPQRNSPIATCAVLLLAGLVAGCAQPGGKTLAKSGTAGTVGSAKAATAAAADTPATATVPPAAASSVLWQDAARLMGLESKAVREALGAPARIRDEETARIYQYIGSDCVLDLFLYESSGIYRVSYAEARSAKAEHKAVDSCLRSLPAPVVADNGQPST